MASIANYDLSHAVTCSTSNVLQLYSNLYSPHTHHKMYNICSVNSKKYPPMMIAMLFSLLLVIVLFLGFRLLLNDKLVSDAIFKIPSLMNSHFYKTKEPPRKLSEINEYNPYFPGAYLAIKLNMIEYKPIGIKEEEKNYI